MPASTVELFTDAVIATARVLLVSATGVLCAKYPKEKPLLGPSVRQSVGRVSLMVFVPSLFAVSVGATLHLEACARVWPLLVCCAFTVLLCVCISSGVARLIGLEGWRLRIFVIAASFQNGVALPMLLLDSLCEAVPELQEGYPTPADCREGAYALTLIYNVPWRLVMFGYVQPWLLRNKDGIAAAAVGGGGRRRYSELGEIADAAPTVEMSAALTPEMVPAQAPDVLQQSPSAAQGVSEPAASGPTASPDGTPRGWHRRAASGAARLCCDINIAVIPVALSIAFIGPLRRSLFADSTHPFSFVGGALRTLGQPLVPVTSLLCAAAMVPEASDEDKTPGSPAALPQSRLERARQALTSGFCVEATALCIVRLVIAPVAVFSILQVVASSGMIHLRPLEWLIAYIEAGCPSAQVLIVVLVAQGQHGMAGRLSRMYVFEYLLAAVTVTVCVTVGLDLII
eukprot:TRINITY_DN13731_c0_g1_i1.p1 TRINITY_DN13731_c0_g1~~TRINITY_DN13731_c0_g1_i1.p1  ORF type:complete len:457 (+),score=60.41 TRINITY_DN13731_c0_g1_i1:67-1437(+)